MVEVDLRRTKVTDADLEIAEAAFTQVRSLNLPSPRRFETPDGNR